MQVWLRARVWPQVEVVRNGHWVVMRRMVSGDGGFVGEGEGLGGGLAGGDLAEVEDVAGREWAAGDGEGAGAGAVAFDVAEGVEGGGAVGGVGLGEEGSGDVSVGEGQEGDGEAAACVGREAGAGWAAEDELAGKRDVEGEGFGGEVVDGELAGEAEGAGGVGAEVGLGGDDLEADVFGGVGAGERDGVVGWCFRAVMTGICRVSVTRALAGVKTTVMVQVAAGARAVQLVVGMKFEVVTWGWRSGAGWCRCWLG